MKAHDPPYAVAAAAAAEHTKAPTSSHPGIGGEGGRSLETARRPMGGRAPRARMEERGERERERGRPLPVVYVWEGEDQHSLFGRIMGDEGENGEGGRGSYSAVIRGRAF